MAERAWKCSVRMIAFRLRGGRVPITGHQRGDVPDIAHPVYSVEVKSGKILPGWLHNAMAQAVAAQRNGQMPVDILHETGTRHADDLVCVRLGEFEASNGAHRGHEGEGRA